MSDTLPPELLSEILNPEDLYKADGKLNTSLVEWQCNNGHKYLQRVTTRLSGRGCSYCANRKVLKGFNDLETVAPEIAALWHPTKNGDLTPDQVVFGSTKKITWVDELGHEWVRSVSEMYLSKSGCPVSTSRQVLAGFNDLESLYPEVAKQWHPTKNNDLMPSQVMKASNKKYWWFCDQGHEWQTPVSKRTLEGRGCPICVSQVIVPGVNDFASTYPEAAKQWHPTKNGDLTPDQVARTAKKNYWWVCDKGHEWQSSPAKRGDLQRGCHFCTNQKVLPGYNDIFAVNSQIATEWHPTKNDLLPSQVVYGSNKLAWWVCDKGHEWQAQVRARVISKNGCPKCPTRSSKPEKEMTEHLEGLGLKVENSVRKLVPGQELDIYLPEQQLAIEYNGLYWHTERAGRGKWYHHEKWKACREQGIQLIQVWEDDWKRNPELVKRMIAHKAGTSTQKVFARKTTILPQVDKQVAATFLEQNHIQGSVDGSIRIGLQAAVDGKQQLVALMVLKREPEGKEVLNLLRFATSVQVVGGFTKLINHIRKTMPEVERIITFSDNCVSDGALYAGTGFVATKQLPPDYMYVSRNVRYHKFGYRLKRFRNDPALVWQEGLTEKQLAELNGLERVWDAGKTKWELTFLR
jgi:G:T-mismatch repair DNA endonuclease (very short patch repair protein)